MKIIKKSGSFNITTVGNPTISNNFIVSDFSTTSYVYLPNINIDTTQSWEINLCFTTKTDISTRQKVLGMNTDYKFATIWFRSSKLYGEIPSTNGSSWDIASENTAYYIISTNTTYYVKMTFNGDNEYKFLVSTDNNSWTTIWTVTSTKKMYNPNNYQIWLGQDQDNDAGVKNRYLRGTIDLKVCDLKSNNNIAWQGVAPEKYYYIHQNNKYYGITNIPSQYQVVDYIQNPTVSGTYYANCYIDTGVYPSHTDIIYFKATFNIANPISSNTNSIGTIFGAEGYGVTDDWKYGLKFGTYSAKTGGEAAIYGTQIDPSLVPNTKMTIELNDHIYTTSNGYSLTIGTYYSSNYRGTIKIFCVQGQNVNYQANMKLYEYKLGKSPTELVIDYVPVLDTVTNKYGVYNLIDGTFKASVGSGNFTGGND